VSGPPSRAEKEDYASHLFPTFL